MIVLASPSNSLTSSLPFSVWREEANTESTKDCFASKVVGHTDLHHKDQNLGRNIIKTLGFDNSQEGSLEGVILEVILKNGIC